MNLMSTSNSFYRYKIEDLNDISDSTFARRVSKAAQNNKKSFFFQVDEKFKLPQLALDFILNRLKKDDFVMTGISNCISFCKSIRPQQTVLNINTPEELSAFLLQKNNSELGLHNLLFSPQTSKDLKCFIDFEKGQSRKYHVFWSFAPYDQNIKNSLTIKEINRYGVNYNKIPGLEIFNTKIPKHFELEPVTDTSYRVHWTFSLDNSIPRISVIIPTYNNVQFLSNVLWHLINQDTQKEDYEIIIADDGSEDQSSEIIYSLFENYKNKVNIRFIYWSKKHPLRGEQQFFRSGLARNLASRYSASSNLLFLDSDMLVPPNFISTCLDSLETHDIIQFQRFHINQELSKSNPHYKSVDIQKDTYIEEANYWSELFFCKNWSDLPNYWKYTCTYTLGISKEKFLAMGLFKKYYISYGFEDTDIGYEAFKRNYKFNLIKIPLLHLTSYDLMQYNNSSSKRFKLLSITAELFYLQHMDKEIFHLLENFYTAQKPLKSVLRDLIS